MLEFNDPQFEATNAVVSEMDRILALAHKMTVASSQNRQLLFQLTKAPVGSLLKINQQHFADSYVIRDSIALMAKSLLTLRNLGEGQIEIDQSDGLGNCPYCETEITRYQPQDDPQPDDPWLVFCSQCIEIFHPEFKRLANPEFGFGTDEI